MAATNLSTLVASPTLQDALVDDSTGLALSGGTITCYKDNSRTTLKNWYYQSGTPGNYTYITLPNPMTLSAAGTIVDVNGNDTIPFFYTVSESDNLTQELYYIVVTNSNGQQEFTRQGFPFIPPSSTATDNPTWRNYIANNVFWRNIGSLSIDSSTHALTNQIFINNSTSYYSATLAPSQHDGFSMPDILYLKNNNTATESFTFQKFGNTTFLPNTITPEYYLNFQCSVAGSSESLKCIQIPIALHINNLNSVNATVVIYAQAGDGNPNDVLGLSINQFLGTGQAVTTPLVIDNNVVLDNSWQAYSFNFSFPAATTTSSVVDDNAFYLQINLPLNQACNVNIAKPCIYLSNTVPSNDIDTYDQVDSIITTQRTGDFRTSMNSSLLGWVLCNDGVISNSGSFVLPTNVPAARQNIDTWPLFNLIWNNSSRFAVGSSNPIAQIYNSSGAATTYGSNAYSDWAANKQLQLTLTLGRALLGLPPAYTVTYDHLSAPTWNSGVTGFFTASAPATLLYVGAPIYLTGTMPASGNFVANTIYYAIPAIDGSSTTQFQLATSYANAIAGTAIAVGAASDNGSNIIANFAIGGSFGQARHVQLEREIATHSHPSSYFQYTAFNVAAGGTAGINVNDTGASHYAINGLQADGNSYPFNVVMPSVYYNIFLKL